MFSEPEKQQIQKIKTDLAQYLESKFIELRGWERGNEVADFIRDNFVVSGGISASLFHRSAVKDVDLYYRETIAVTELNEKLQQMFIQEHAPYQHLVKDINPSYLQGEVNGKLITVNAITLKNNLQLIRLAGIRECQQIFDFKHCLPVYDIAKNVYGISRNSFDSLQTRKLMTHRGQPKSHRLEKFKQRGWSFN